MNIKPMTIAQSLNKAYLKQDISITDYNRFIQALRKFFKSFNTGESEENQKNTIAEFLRNAHYQDNYLINTSHNIDQAIYHGPNPHDPVAVLIEAKRLSEKKDMISIDNPNAKAMQEAISYYLRQSIIKNNKEIKHIIITNSQKWYIFDGGEFEREFYNNKYINTKFQEFKHGLFGSENADWLYKFIQSDIIPQLKDFSCTHFDLFEYREYLDQPDKTPELIELFKILSPEHLLKKPFANDSNTLDSQFYDELLHIIGIEESKDAGKKILTRLSPEKRHEGSLLENTINNLRINNSIANLTNADEYGANTDEQLFSIGLELVITWLNRILFMKLLEAQLISFHADDYDYKFLSSDRIEEFDDLQELFFEVLALSPRHRGKYIINRYPKIPYLNSSLFEITPLEQKTIKISDLKDRYKMPISAKTVLKNIGGDRISGEMHTQKYLLDFLDAYNFAGDGIPGLQEVNKTIINSSVLGLIFEKLNGYKDGSFFTPGYITMYMCREAISRAVVAKFNAQYGWSCSTLHDIYNKLDSTAEKLFEYNKVFNSIRLVDPAVGSGHFLVSALNEFIRIKSDLGILIDENGRRLRDYKIEIENDEIIISDDEGKIFAYLSPEVAAGAKREEMQRVQKTIFHEKQTIIENCLFGVDINPKSVSICRLRLWIELLKNMYYKPSTDPKGETSDIGKLTPDPKGEMRITHDPKAEITQWELEVLPNIDINIKHGNSLISRFAIDDTAKISLGDAKIIPLYKKAVRKYKSATDKAEKAKIVTEIDNYIKLLKKKIADTSVKHLELIETKLKLDTLLNQTDLFAASKSKKEEKEFTKQVEILNKKIATLQIEVEDIEKNPIYAHAFEWRFEFPELLNDDGDFVGFDVVIGNPPYGTGIDKNINKLKEMFPNSTKEHVDIFKIFVEFSFRISKYNANISLILPNTILQQKRFDDIRKIVLQNNLLAVVNLGENIFDAAIVPACIIICQKENNNNSIVKMLDVSRSDKKYLIEKIIVQPNYEYETQNEMIAKNEISKKIFSIQNPYVLLGDIEEIKIKDVGMQCQRKNVGREARTKSNLAEKIFLNERINNECVMYWKGRDISKYYAEKTTNRYFRTDYKALLEDNESVYINTEVYNSSEKIIMRQTADRIIAYYDNKKKWFDGSIIGLINTANKQYSLKFILAVINSEFIRWYYQELVNEANRVFAQIKVSKLKQLPIPIIRQNEQEPFIKLVDIILAKKENGENTDAEEKQIDMMVYNLYGLSEKEIEIIEGQ